MAEAEIVRQEKDQSVAAAVSARQDKDRAVTEALGARKESHDADAARKKAKTEADGLRLEFDGPITHAAVRAVLHTPQGLPQGFMGDDESEIPSFLKTHNSMERDACVERACDLDTQYFRAHEHLVNCRLSVENLLLEDKGEESREVLEATKLRNATYQEYLAASKKLLEACDAENGLIGRVRKQNRNKATKACAGRLFQVASESGGNYRDQDSCS